MLVLFSASAQRPRFAKSFGEHSLPKLSYNDLFDAFEERIIDKVFVSRKRASDRGNAMASDHERNEYISTDVFPSSDDAAFQIGTAIGDHYELLRPLGTGSWGIVWKARDMNFQQGDEFVALKFVRLKRDGEARTADDLRQVITELEQEVTWAKSVDNRHVCRVLGFHPGKSPFSEPGELEPPEHRPFAEFEFVDGWRLADLFKMGHRLAMESAVKVAVQFCEGLLAIHSADLIHHDLQPNNIMLDKERGVKIVDFGLVLPFSVPGSRLGTLCYTSPEKLNAYLKLDTGFVPTPSSDIYSVGAILFQLFTGEELHKVDSTGKLAFEAVRLKQETLNDQKLRNRMYAVSPQIQNCVIRCLKFKPEDRFSSTAEVLQALRKWQGDQFPTASIEYLTVRDHARPAMRDEMQRACHLVFVGTTQEKLEGDLTKIITGGVDRLHWREIDVFFINEQIARGLRFDDYHRQIRNSRRAIAKVITGSDAQARLSQPVTLRFYECDKHAYPYNGSMFRNDESVDGFNVVFSTHPLPGRSRNLREALTYRLVKGRLGNDDLIEVHAHQIDRLKLPKVSLDIGTFELSSWDLSCEDWNTYVDECVPHQESMRALAELSVPPNGYREDDEVLYVAAGDVRTCSILLDEVRPARLTVLDSSPQLLSRIEEQLNASGEQRISYALASLPDLPDDKCDACFDLRGKERAYRTIVVHHSLSPLTRERTDKIAEDLILDLAKWCRHYLIDEGTVVIAAHSGELKIKTDLRDPSDPIRKAICGKAGVAYKETNEPLRLTVEKVVHAFMQHGFRHVKISGGQQHLSVDEVEIPFFQQEFSMQNRRSLWHVPAILETLVGRDRCEDKEVLKGAGAAILDGVQRSFIREVCLFKFRVGGGCFG